MVKVVIVGGGFGGINAAKALAKASVDIILIDRTNHHLFQPLLYQVATAALSVGNIASPIREVLRNQQNATVIMAQVERIDVQSQQVLTDVGAFAYDYLILAPGAKHAYFGHDEWEKYAPGLKTVEDAVKIREQMLVAFEKAERCEDPVQAQSYLSFVIIGGGPTGVEMAGSLAEFAHRTLFKNFRRINPATTKIYLIEGASQVLPSYPSDLAQHALQDLKNLGVSVILNTFVTNITAEGIYMAEQFLPASCIIWAAGNQASPLLQSLGVPLDRQGRAIVNLDTSIPGHSNVFVIGDAAYFKDKKGEALAGIAPVAIQQARYVATIIKNKIMPENRKPFVYFDKGYMATIGRGKAVAVVRKLHFSGLFAWLAWCFIHILYLVSFRYRVLVMVQWLFWYVTSRRYGRVINRPIDQIEGLQEEVAKGEKEVLHKNG
jgi:NADH dehydrogenase